MQAVSAAFTEAVSGDHAVAVAMEITNAAGNVIYSTVTDPTLRILSGNVTMEKSADVRSHCSVKLADPTLSFVPTSPTDTLTPFGNQITLYRGVAYADGTTELVKLCTNRISTVQVSDSGGVTITVTGFGRERTIQRNTIPVFWPPPSMVHAGGALPLLDGSNVPLTPSQCPFYTDFIRVLIADRMPGVVFNSDAATWSRQQYAGTDVSTRLNYGGSMQLSQGADPWGAVRSTATLVGCDLFFDRTGVCTLIRDPNLAIMDGTLHPTPVLSFVEGETATFMNLTRTLSDENGFNACVVVGAGSALVGPVQTPYFQNQDSGSDPFAQLNPYVLANDPRLGYPVVYDSDPNSPTYFFGPYGKVVHVENNSLIFNSVVAKGYSETLLKRAIGVQELVAFDGVVNPALDVDDVISVQRERAGIGVGVLYVIDSLDIPLDAVTPMKVKLRERRALV